MTTITDKIISLEVENVKRVKALFINADDTMNVISGKNGNGKTSTLDAIEMVLRGAKFIPDMAVRAGEETARIVMNTEKMRATRHWTNPSTSYLKLESKEFGKIANAQEALNLMVGDLSFDPLEFSTMEPKKRLVILKQLTGLDFDSLDKEYKEIFTERTGIKKEYETFKSTIETFPAKELTKPEFDIEDIQLKRSAAEDHNRIIDDIDKVEIPKHKQDIEKFVTESANLVLECQEIDKEVKRLYELKNNKISLIDAKRGAVEFLEKSMASLLETRDSSEKIDTSQFDKMIQQHTQYESDIANEKRRQDLIKKRDEKFTQANKITSRLEEIVVLKNKQLSEAKMPIEGLNFSENDITFKDIPFIQLSTSEQIQVSMSIAMALNPRLRIIIIKNGSLLDSEAMEKIKLLAKENNFQIWLEKVADGPDDNSFYIHEGELYGATEVNTGRVGEVETETNTDQQVH